MYRSNTEVYAGESIALELDVTFPPWSGSNPINFTFQPQTLVFANNQTISKSNLCLSCPRLATTTSGECARLRLLTCRTTWSVWTTAWQSIWKAMPHSESPTQNRPYPTSNNGEWEGWKSYQIQISGSFQVWRCGHFTSWCYLSNPVTCKGEEQIPGSRHFREHTRPKFIL